MAEPRRSTKFVNVCPDDGAYGMSPGRASP